MRVFKPENGDVFGGQDDFGIEKVLLRAVALLKDLHSELPLAREV